MSKEYLDCYLRVSSKIQKTQGHSIPAQREIAKRLAKSTKLIYREHNEGDKSATRVGTKRNLLDDIKDGIERGDIKNFWVWEHSRLFRDEYESLFFDKYFLSKYSIKFFSSKNAEGVQHSPQHFDLMYLLESYMSAEEGRNIRRRSVRGKRYLLDNVSQSKPVFLGGSPTYGYDSIDKLWVINKETSKWVKWMFQSYVDGVAIIELKKHLDRSNVKPIRAKLWKIETILKMLHNQSYTGIKKYYDKELEQEWIYKIPQIISVSLFRKVQRMLIKNRKSKDNNKKHQFLLDGLLYCECGSGMGSESKRRKERVQECYYCYSTRRKWRGEDTDCLNDRSLSRETTELELMNVVKEVASNSVLLKEQFKNDILSKKFDSDKDIKNEKKRLERKVKELQRTIEHTDDNLSQVIFERMQDKKGEGAIVLDKVRILLEEEKKNGELEYEKTIQDIEGLDSRKEWLNWLSAYGKSLTMKISTDKKKRDFLEGLVKKIVVKIEYGKNRDNKEIQVGQTFDIHFNMKIVNDKLVYNDINDKSLGYELIDGKFRKRSKVLGLVNTVGKPKKKALKTTV